MRNEVFTAETAVKRILEREELAAATAKTGAEKRPMKIKKEAPKWSNPDLDPDFFAFKASVSLRFSLPASNVVAIWLHDLAILSI